MKEMVWHLHCGWIAGGDGVRGGHIPEAGAVAAAVSGGTGQRAAAARNHLRQPAVPAKIHCSGRLIHDARD